MTDFNLYSYINYDKTTSYFASLLMSGNINYLYYEIDIENHKIKYKSFRTKKNQSK